MSIKDVKSKQFLKDPERFADVFNVFLYDGEQVIKPEDLEEKDISELLSLYYGVNSEEITKQKWRDLLKKAVLATAEGTCYVLLGVENQSEVHSAMPVRNMIYDAVNYGTQVEEARRKHEKERRGSSTKTGKRTVKTVYSDSGEFLSGFTRADKITPVITLVIYWGSDKWDGPVSLHEMLDMKDKKLLKYIPDYRINLLEPCAITDFTKFRTCVGEVLQVIKVSKDMNKMKEVMEQKEVFRHLDVDAVRMLNVFTNLKIRIRGRKRRIDVCKAWDDWYECGKSAGIEQGIERNMVDNLRNMIKNLGISLEQALLALMVPEDEWNKYKNLV